MEILLDYIKKYYKCPTEEAKIILNEIEWDIENAIDRAEACSYLEENGIPTDLIAYFGY